MLQHLAADSLQFCVQKGNRSVSLEGTCFQGAPTSFASALKFCLEMVGDFIDSDITGADVIAKCLLPLSAVSDVSLCTEVFAKHMACVVPPSLCTCSKNVLYN